jgi:uncharacterized alkaline shock family protein YloU
VSTDLFPTDRAGITRPNGADTPVPGMVRISDGAAAKLASRAAVELPDVGAAAPRFFGRTVPVAGHLGIRETSLSALPATSAQIDGHDMFVDMSVSVRWPASVPQVAAKLRHHVRERVQALTGLRVVKVRITVTDLTTDRAPARVRQGRRP